jgi:amino acid transporter
MSKLHVFWATVPWQSLFSFSANAIAVLTLVGIVTPQNHSLLSQWLAAYILLLGNYGIYASIQHSPPREEWTAEQRQAFLSTHPTVQEKIK